jgi:hypothetical protein
MVLHPFFSLAFSMIKSKYGLLEPVLQPELLELAEQVEEQSFKEQSFEQQQHVELEMQLA